MFKVPASDTQYLSKSRGIWILQFRWTHVQIIHGNSNLLKMMRSQVQLLKCTQSLRRTKFPFVPLTKDETFPFCKRLKLPCVQSNPPSLDSEQKVP